MRKYLGGVGAGVRQHVAFHHRQRGITLDVDLVHTDVNKSDMIKCTRLKGYLHFNRFDKPFVALMEVLP